MYRNTNVEGFAVGTLMLGVVMLLLGILITPNSTDISEKLINKKIFKEYNHVIGIFEKEDGDIIIQHSNTPKTAQTTSHSDPIHTRPETGTNEASVAPKAHPLHSVELLQRLTPHTAQNHTKTTPNVPAIPPIQTRWKTKTNKHFLMLLFADVASSDDSSRQHVLS